MEIDPRACFDDWTDREAIAERMVPLVGRLYRRSGVIVSTYGRSLVNESVTGILKAHRFARHVIGRELEPGSILPILATIATLELAPARIDAGRLAVEYARCGDAENDLLAFVRRELDEVIQRAAPVRPEPTDVVLFGFGRIGRLVARQLIQAESDGNPLRLRAVVVRTGGPDDLAKRASLLRRDSVHGPFAGTITIDERASSIVANGTAFRVIQAEDAGGIDYTAYGISKAVVVDNTGRWRDQQSLSRHLVSRGVSRVLLTAPGKGTLKNIVHGINHDQIGSDDRIIAAASCTTNAVAPVLKALNDSYGVVRGHVETVHSFTNDQNLTDNFHRGARRGRSAALNMVIAETGAARAVAKALPELEGRLTGNAIRVPTPDVSLAILNLTLGVPIERAALNAFLRLTSLDSDLQRQVDYIESSEIVSSDILGSRRAGVVDGLATIADGSEHVVLYVWYDNETGYSSQVVRVLETLAGRCLPDLPARRSQDAGRGARAATG